MGMSKDEIEILFREEDLQPDLHNLLKSIWFSAAKNNNLHIIELFIQHSVIDIHQVYTGKETEWTALMIAALNGYVPMAKFLIENGARVNEKHKDGWTPLMVAAQNGHITMVELLLEKGAEINAVNGGDANALMIAAGHEHAEVAACLLQRGAQEGPLQNTPTGAVLTLSIAKNRMQPKESAFTTEQPSAIILSKQAHTAEKPTVHHPEPAIHVDPSTKLNTKLKA